MAGLLTNIFEDTSTQPDRSLDIAGQRSRESDADRGEANPDDDGGGASRGELDGAFEDPQSIPEPEPIHCGVDIA